VTDRARHRRGWLPAAAAAATMTAAAGAFALARTGSTTGDPSPGAVVMTTMGTTTTDPVPDLLVPDLLVPDLVVRAGMAVEASGTVVAAAGQPVRFCAPALVPGVGMPGDAGVPPCPFGVTVVGVNLDALAEATTAGGARFGQALIRGMWQSGTLTVTRQSEPASIRPAENPPPCTAPSGGWAFVPGADNRALFMYVLKEHPDQFRYPSVTYPNGHPHDGTSPAADTIEVLVVEVVNGDVNQAREELRRRFNGNLCVVDRSGSPSLADQERIRTKARPALETLMRDPSTGVYGTRSGDVVLVDVVMVTSDLAERFSQLGLGPEVQLAPWLRPTRS
jgi:hypothetical protein